MSKKPPSTPQPKLRGRIWIELNGGPALTEPGADLLEQIQICGSLSQAARRLHFSYRRAWMLLDNMNRRWPTPLVTTSTGGKHGGGAKLTELGVNVLRAYRDLQLQVEHLLGRQTDIFIATTK
jgi:molybdate transport system regulatory protein